MTHSRKELEVTTTTEYDETDNGETTTYDEAWLRAAPIEDIRSAFASGHLHELLAPEGQITSVDGMTPDEIAEAHAAGKLKHLMSGQIPGMPVYRDHM